MTKYCIIKHDEIREQRLQGENGSMWKMETLCIEHLQNSSQWRQSTARVANGARGAIFDGTLCEFKYRILPHCK